MGAFQAEVLKQPRGLLRCFQWFFALLGRGTIGRAEMYDRTSHNIAVNFGSGYSIQGGPGHTRPRFTSIGLHGDEG